jgi:hypothetical protein
MERRCLSQPLKRMRRKPCTKQKEVQEQIEQIDLQIRAYHESQSQSYCESAPTKEANFKRLISQKETLMKRLQNLEKDRKRQSRHREKVRRLDIQSNGSVQSPSVCGTSTSSILSPTSQQEIKTFDGTSIELKLLKILESPILFFQFVTKYGDLLDASKARGKLFHLREVMCSNSLWCGPEAARMLMLQYLLISSRPGLKSQKFEA